jgi:hypothetical protein
MPALTRRLARLEEALDSLADSGRCRLCWGEPWPAIHIMYEDDPNKPGYRKTGERILAKDSCNRFTDDLRCVACGARGRELHIITIVGIGPPPEGRVLSPRSTTVSPEEWSDA